MGRGSRATTTATSGLDQLLDGEGQQSALWVRKHAARRRLGDQLTVTSANGKQFTVKLVRQGDRYGRDDKLVNEQAMPLVEFYDSTYAGQEGFDPEGQFVSRYSLETLISDDRISGGLILDGGIPAWQLTGPGWQQTQDFLRAQHQAL